MATAAGIAGPSRSPVRASRQVVLVGADSMSMAGLRGGAIAAMRRAGHRVTCLIAEGASEARSVAELKAMGADVSAYPLRDGQVHPLADRRTIDALSSILRDLQPHAVLGYGLKPMLLAAIAARRARVERIVALASTLGELGRLQSSTPGAPGLMMHWLLRSGLRASTVLVCHNAGLASWFAAARVLPPHLPVHVVPGGGVDLAAFAELPLPPPAMGSAGAPGLVFAMVGRLERAKGVIEFCEAARRVRENSPGSRFVLAGPAMSGPGGLQASDIAQYADCIEYAGAVEDVRPVLAACHVFVLPSHHEGFSRTLLEALAIGRPAVASNIPGCREAIDERVNGVLVPPGDVSALAAALESLLRRPELLVSMATASRRKAERRFDAAAVEARLLTLLELEHC